MTVKELNFKGIFRFHHEFRVAVEMMQAGRLVVARPVTHEVPLADAPRAFDVASDRNRAIKIHLSFP